MTDDSSLALSSGLLSGSTLFDWLGFWQARPWNPSLALLSCDSIDCAAFAFDSIMSWIAQTFPMCLSPFQCSRTLITADFAWPAVGVLLIRRHSLRITNWWTSKFALHVASWILSASPKAYYTKATRQPKEQATHSLTNSLSLFHFSALFLPFSLPATARLLCWLSECQQSPPQPRIHHPLSVYLKQQTRRQLG